MDDRLVTAARVEDDAQYEAGLRPRRLDEYIGQDRIRENLQVAIAAAKQRAEPLDHVLLHGPPGLGKTTLAYVIANELGVPVRATSGPAIEKPGDLVGIVTNLAPKEVLFIDEIHRMSPAVEEILYPALEDYEVDIVIGQGPSARTVKMRLEPFTLIGATTRTGLLTSPLRSRFGITHRLEFYTPADLEEIVRRSARILSVPIEDAAAAEIAKRARGTPRIANRLLRRVRDYAQVRATGDITIARRDRGPAAARGGRARLRRDRSQAAADDHRQVRRRTGRPEHDRGGDQRGKGRDRRHLRTVPDPDWLPGSNAARARGDASGVRLLRAARARKGFTTVVTAEPRGLRCGGRPTTIRSLATYVPPRLLTNADLRRWWTTDEWILQRTGIRERHVVDLGVATSDLGKEAALQAIEKAGL